MVEFDLLESLRYFKELQSTENTIGIKLLQNNFIKFISPELIQEITSQQIMDGAPTNENLDFVNELQTNPYLELIDEVGIYVDYKLLAQYINWIVKTPDLVELDNGGVIMAEELTKYYKKQEQPIISTTNDVVDTENKKVIADVLDKNAEITNPGGRGHKFIDGQSGSDGGAGYSGNGGGGGGYVDRNNYGNRQEYR